MTVQLREGQLLNAQPLAYISAEASDKSSATLAVEQEVSRPGKGT